MQRVYQIHVDQSNMVNEQGNMIDIIGEEMLKAQDNVEDANEQMIEASIQQKKSTASGSEMAMVLNMK